MRGKYFIGAAAAALLAAFGLAPNAAAQDGADPAADASTRARIAVGDSVSGTLSPEGDSDWYRLSARTGQLYTITLNSAGEGEGALGDPMLILHSRGGDEIASNDDSEGSLNSRLQYTPPANGDVFIDARGYGDGATGAYTLGVTATRLPPDSAGNGTNTRARLTLGQSAGGTLDYAGDADWYRIALEAGQQYRFTLNSAEGEGTLPDPLLRLLGPSGDEIAVDDDGGGALNSYLEFSPTESGNYFLEASAFGGGATGSYVLTGRLGEIAADASTDAVLLADGAYRESTLSPRGDKDWFRIDLTEGQAIRIGVSSTGETPLGDPYIVLYGPDGAELARDDDGGEGLNSWIEYMAPVAGAYHLEVRGFVEEEAEGRYAISLTGGEIPGDRDGAEGLMVGGEGRNSVIQPAGDADWFVIEMVEGRPYRFNLQGAGDAALSDPVLTLYDTNGAQIAQDDDGGSGQNSYLSFTSPTGGAYYAAVTGYGDTLTGQYYLSVVDNDVPGNLGSDELLDTENGDDRTSAIDMIGDLDVFQAGLTEGQRYEITVSGAGDHPLADPFLAILNSSGEQVMTDDDSGPGLDARLTFAPTTNDVFYLQASGLGGSTGGYTITIARR